MRTCFLALFVTLVTLASPVFACNDHAPGTEPVQRPVARTASIAAGEVREVDPEEGTITLKHGRIASLRMASMSSMMFKASDTKMLANLKPGDKVNFRASIIGQQPTVTQVSLVSR